MMFLKQKMDAAQGFIDAVKQRQNTLMTTMQAIIDLQRPFFLEGDESLLRPMILKDVAERTGLDISTISRVSNSKYVQTNYGIVAEQGAESYQSANYGSGACHVFAQFPF